MRGQVMPGKKAGILETAADKAGELAAKVVSAPLDIAAAVLDGVAEAVAKKPTDLTGVASISEREAPKKRAKRAPSKRAAAPQKKRGAAPKKKAAGAPKKKRAAKPKKSAAARKGRASSPRGKK